MCFILTLMQKARFNSQFHLPYISYKVAQSCSHVEEKSKWLSDIILKLHKSWTNHLSHHFYFMQLQCEENMITSPKLFLPLWSTNIHQLLTCPLQLASVPKSFLPWHMRQRAELNCAVMRRGCIWVAWSKVTGAGIDTIQSAKQEQYKSIFNEWFPRSYSH